VSLLRRITNNWPTKLAALVLAFAVWFWHTVASNPVETMRMQLAVTLVGREDDKQYEVTPKTVGVILRAPREVMRKLERRRADLRVEANVGGLPPDQRHNVLLHVRCDAPDFADLEAAGVQAEIDRKFVRVLVVQLDRKTVPVRIVYTREPPEEYDLGKLSVVPEEVEVRGTKEVVAPVRSVKAFVDPTKLLPQPYLVVPVRPVDAEDNYLDATQLEINPPEVTVSAAPEKRVVKTIPVVPTVEGQPAEGYIYERALASPATVEVTGDARVIEKLAALPTEVINIDGRRQTFRQTASLRPPEGVTPRNISSVEVTVIIRRAAQR